MNTYNTYLVFIGIIATAIASPDGLLDGNDGHVSLSQNTIGTYKFNVHLKDSSRSEERFKDGSVVGEYTVPDASGVPQTYKYTSGSEGFRIVEGPLPVAPVGVAIPVAGGPAPVEDTPEVKAAKEEFFALQRAAHL